MDKNALIAEARRRGLKTNKEAIHAELEKRGLGVSKKPLSPDMGGAGDTDTLKDFYTGIKTSLGSMSGGLQQLIPSKLNPFNSSPEQLEQEHLKRNQEYAQAKQRSPWAATIGNVGTSMAIPVPGMSKLRGITEGAEHLGKFLAGKLGVGAVEGAAVGSTQYTPEGESKLSQALISAGLGSTITGALGGAGRAWNSARPSTWLRGNQTKEQLASRMEAARGTETNLGQILQNPRLAGFYENYLSKLPLSGATSASQRTADNIRNQYGEQLNRMTGGIGKDEANRILQDKLEEIPTELRNLSRSNYEKVNSLSENVGGNVGRENTEALVQDVMGRLQRSPELRSLFPKDLQKDLKQYSSKHKGDTLEATNILKGDWGSRAYDYKHGSYPRGIAQGINRSLKKDIQDYIEKSTSPELKQAYTTAEEFYKNNIAPLKGSEISKFIEGRSSPDKIVKTFVKAEEPVLLAKLTELLNKEKGSERGMQALRSGVFSGAIEDGVVNPNKFNTILGKLNTQQKKDLGLEGFNKNLDKLGRLTEMNQAGLYAMFNPKTGHQLGDYLGAKSLLSGGGLGPGQMAKNFLTNEKTREKLIEKMLHPELQDEEMLIQLGKLLEKNLGRTVASQTAQSKEQK